MTAVRALVTLVGLLALWEGVARLGLAPAFLLPTASAAFARAFELRALIAEHALATLGVALAGLALGSALGAGLALALAASDAARRWLTPLLVGAQAAPVFALAPLFTLWLGFGAEPKIALATLGVFFPVASAFADGLARADPALVELARVMGATRRAILWRIRAPAALPALGSGLRLAAVFAPIAAVIGEWAGGARGLGALMLYANARADAALLFAAIALLAALGVALHALVAALARRAAPWAREDFH